MGVVTGKKKRRGSNTIAGSKSSWKKFGAMPYMTVKFVLFVLFFMTLMIFFMTVMLEIMMGGSSKGDGNSLPNLSQIGTFVMIIAMICFFQMLSQLRTLRSLPIARVRLAAWLVLYPFVLTLGANLYAQGIYIVFFDGVFDDSAFRLGMLSAAILVLGVPVIALFWRLNLFVLVMLIMFAGLVQSIPEISRQFGLNGDQHHAVFWVLSGILVLLSWYLTNKGLKSSKPWRAGALKMPMMARRS